MNITILGTGNMARLSPGNLPPRAGPNIHLGYGAGLGTLIAPTWLRQA